MILEKKNYRTKNEIIIMNMLDNSAENDQGAKIQRWVVVLAKMRTSEMGESESLSNVVKDACL